MQKKANGQTDRQTNKGAYGWGTEEVFIGGVPEFLSGGCP